MKISYFKIYFLCLLCAIVYLASSQNILSQNAPSGTFFLLSSSFSSSHLLSLHLISSSSLLSSSLPHLPSLPYTICIRLPYPSLTFTMHHPHKFKGVWSLQDVPSTATHITFTDTFGMCTPLYNYTQPSSHIGTLSFTSS